MSAIVTLAVSLAGSLPIRARSAWFGRSDIPWFVVWSVPLSLATIPVARMIRSKPWRPTIRIGGAVAVGLTLGLLWSFFVIAAHGVFIGAVSIPFVVIWPFAAAAGIVGEVSFQSPQRAPFATGALLIALTACPVVAVESRPYITGAQVLTVVKMKIVKPSDTLDILDPAYLLEADIQLLKKSGVRGVVQLVGTSTIGRRGPTARALVVSMSPLDRNLVVNQPRHASAVYIQSHDHVDIFPADAPLHRWRLRFTIEREGSFDKSINIFQEAASGWAGGGLIHW